MDNVTVEKLEAKFKGEGKPRFAEIATLGGFGDIARSAVDKTFEGGLDLTGVLDPENKAVSEGSKSKIRELAGLTKSEDKSVKEK